MVIYIVVARFVNFWNVDKKDKKMNYEVRRHGDKYKVYEVKTEMYLLVTKDRIKAESVCDSLNRGCGFAGESPYFFSNLAKGFDETSFT